MITRAGAAEELGIEIDPFVHRDVLHMLEAAGDLHVFEAGHDRVAASLTACKLEPQRRLTVVPPASIGSPAISATVRATFRPCSPCCCVLPSTTSSIAAGSMPVRLTAPRPQRRPDRRTSRRDRRLCLYGPAQSACARNPRRRRFSCLVSMFRGTTYFSCFPGSAWEHTAVEAPPRHSFNVDAN